MREAVREGVPKKSGIGACNLLDGDGVGCSRIGVYGCAVCLFGGLRVGLLLCIGCLCGCVLCQIGIVSIWFGSVCLGVSY